MFETPILFAQVPLRHPEKNNPTHLETKPQKVAELVTVGQETQAVGLPQNAYSLGEKMTLFGTLI
jgi:hypothetical protein